MPKDPTIAIRDCLAEIAVLHGIAARMTLESFKCDPIGHRAAAYAIQTISEAVRQIPEDWLAEFPTEPWAHRSKASAIASAMSTFASTTRSCGKSSSRIRTHSRQSWRRCSPVTPMAEHRDRLARWREIVSVVPDY